MIHLKIYEDFGKPTYTGEYWLLPTDDRFYKSLVSINCPDSKIKHFLNTENMIKIFIGVGIDLMAL